MQSVDNSDYIVIALRGQIDLLNKYCFHPALECSIIKPFHFKLNSYKEAEPEMD